MYPHASTSLSVTDMSLTSISPTVITKLPISKSALCNYQFLSQPCAL